MYRGATEQFISKGTWRQHPLKLWPEVDRILKGTPCHGEEASIASYTIAEFMDKLTTFRVEIRKIVHALEADQSDGKKRKKRSKRWSKTEEKSLKLLETKKALNGQPFSYGDPLREFDQLAIKKGYPNGKFRYPTSAEFLVHFKYWEEYAKELTIATSRGRTRDVNDVARDLLPNAYCGVEFSLTRGVTDHFWDPDMTQSFLGDQSLGKRSLQFIEIQHTGAAGWQRLAPGKAGWRELNIIKRDNTLTAVRLSPNAKLVTTRPDFMQLKQHGSFLCHGYTRRDQTLTTELQYEYHMLNARKRLEALCLYLSRNAPNSPVHNFVQQKCEYIRGLVQNNNLLSSFRAHGAVNPGVVPMAEQTISSFKRTNPAPRAHQFVDPYFVNKLHEESKTVKARRLRDEQKALKFQVTYQPYLKYQQY